MSNSASLIEVDGLTVRAYDARSGVGLPVDRVTFRIGNGQVLGVTGESGSGKTTIAYSILRLIGDARRGISDPQRSVSSAAHVVAQREIVEGKITFKDRDLLSLSDSEMQMVRGKEISMIFQNPIASMNPRMMVGYQVGEPREVHEKLRWERITKLVFEYLGKVQLPGAKIRAYHDPHKFSGGEGQRIMIAMALICNPSLLIADEPTSSLDVTIQRQVLELLKALKREFGLSILYITHDLGVVFEMSDKLAIMYAGNIVEYGDARQIYKRPRHPYTRGIKEAYPDLYAPRRSLKPILGNPPTCFDKFQGCKFFPRCSYAKPSCNLNRPSLTDVAPGHSVSCLRTDEI